MSSLRGFIDDHPCRRLVAAGGGVGLEPVDGVRSGRHSVNVLGRTMLLMEIGFLPQLLSAAPAHDSASVITPPAACALSRDDDRQRICRYLTAPYKCRCNFLAFSAADGRSRLYPQARHAGEREPPGELMKEVECAGRGPLMLGWPASSGDRMRLGSRRSAPAGRHPRPYKTGEQGRRRSPTT